MMGCYFELFFLLCVFNVGCVLDCFWHLVLEETYAIPHARVLLSLSAMWPVAVLLWLLCLVAVLPAFARCTPNVS
jgi:hypothetical protein